VELFGDEVEKKEDKEVVAEVEVDLMGEDSITFEVKSPKKSKIEEIDFLGEDQKVEKVEENKEEVNFLNDLDNKSPTNPISKELNNTNSNDILAQDDDFEI